MTMLRLLVLIIAVTSLAGCIDRPPHWRVRHVPTTDDERRAIADHVEKVIGGAVRKLGGDDQDWELSMLPTSSPANRSAAPPCGESAYNGHYYDWTGRWRYAEPVNAAASMRRPDDAQ